MAAVGGLPMRPTHLLARAAASPTAAAAAASPSPRLERAPQSPPSATLAAAPSRSSIAEAAALAAVAFNQQPHLFSRQFHSQLQVRARAEIFDW